MDPDALRLLLADDSYAAQVIILGRRDAVERISSRLEQGLPLDVTSARKPVPASGRPRGDRTVVAHLDVRTAA